MTAAELDFQEVSEQFLRSLDKGHLDAAASRLLSASIGDIVTVLSRSPAHKHYSLADIEWLILPPVIGGQFYVVEATHRERGFRAPVAVVTWALVSEEVDQRLQEGVGRRKRLRPDEWTGGEIGWLIDAVGGSTEIHSALHHLANGPFKDRELKIAERHERGTSITTLKSILFSKHGQASEGIG